MKRQKKAVNVFTLQSIKSRIETVWQAGALYARIEFLLYSPLNQGLKLGVDLVTAAGAVGFLLYSPLNQGLKL